jgi:hypothetical protein
MSKITVTAGEGVRAQVLVRKHVDILRTLPAVTGSEGQILVPEKVETYRDTQTVDVVTFASESRSFDLGPNEHLMVLEQ